MSCDDLAENINITHESRTDAKIRVLPNQTKKKSSCLTTTGKGVAVDHLRRLFFKIF